MNNRVTHFAAHWATLAVSAALAGLPLEASAQASHSASKSARDASASSSEHHAHAMHKSMMDSMKDMQSMQPTGNLDHDFATMMRKHHQSGVDMARHEAEHGKDPKMREMAKKIMASQQREIKEFDRWLQTHQGKGADRK